MSSSEHLPADPVELTDIKFADVRTSLAQGLQDFRRAPLIGMFFGAVFSVLGIVIYLQLVVWGTSYWALPLMAGFPLIGPFVAVGLYDVSRRLEAGDPIDWGEVLTVIAQERGRQIPSMAFVALFFFLAWVYFAHLVFALTFGLRPLTNISSEPDLLFSGAGLAMLSAGTLVGGALALLLFSISVISVPLLLDREIDVVTAMITSVRSVMDNPQAMLGWGVVVAVLTAVAMVPFFLGMIVIFPILGHASWHLYRKVVLPKP
ncbi:MAG: DUF2189 domain-containing protein [Pseudomonadota bacterium]